MVTATLPAERAAAIHWETRQFSQSTAPVVSLVRTASMTVEAQRRAEGEVHPELRPVVLERNVLEWRLDPRSAARLPWVTDETRVLVLCQEGYASSLAAATLVRLGLTRATDVVGGLRAWREAGLPLAA